MDVDDLFYMHDARSLTKLSSVKFSLIFKVRKTAEMSFSYVHRART